MLTIEIIELFSDQAKDLYDFLNSEATIAELDYPLESYLSYPKTVTTLRDGLQIRIQYHSGRIMVHSGSDYSEDYVLSPYSYWSYGRVTLRMTEFEIFYKLLELFADIVETATAFDYDEATD